MAAAIRVLIADDQALLRGSFRVLVDATAGMQVVGEAADGATAVRLARELLPDVVLMDLRMPVLDGVAATRALRADDATAGVRVLVLTMFDVDEYVYPALEAGASGFLLKDASPLDLIDAIRVVHAGEGVLAPAVTRRLLGTFQSTASSTPSSTPPSAASSARSSSSPSLGGGASPRQRLVGLTPREQEVLVLVAGGLSNAEIAEALVVGLPTVKSHVGKLLAKLSARDRAQLVVVAYESGLVGRGSAR